LAATSDRLLRRKPLGPVGLVVLTGLALAACTVGPEYVPPEPEAPAAWSQPGAEGVTEQPASLVAWWTVFKDPVLDQLVDTAVRRNNTLELTALRVLEARAQLGIATGSVYPQTQVATGAATYLSPPDNSGVDSGAWSYGLGAGAAWEIDFWGRFRRGIESADAAYLASIAAFEQSRILLTGAVVGTYATVRSLEEQLRIANENVAIQQRSFDIAQVLFENGADSELDMQQALTLLLSTQATIPGLEIALAQAQNALSVLLGEAPGAVREVLTTGEGIPVVPDDIAIGLPADMLRRRPDVRQAELQARSANALVGLAEADLYPSFSLTGSIGLAAGGPGDSDFGDLFDGDALTWSIGPSFVWPFLNYGRIRNNVRVQDARLQQALVNYRETVLQAAREAEDAMATYIGTRAQRAILEQTVESARRSNDLSTLRYAEGFSDYERVLNAQQALFTQETRYVTNQGDAVRALVDLYTALGGGWENDEGLPRIDPETLEAMGQRTNWGDLLDPYADDTTTTTRTAEDAPDE
jgi:NodT family efflux transporter outer membrane factor (OMF) lipoprotein